MLTYDVSAGLHATPFLATERYTEATIAGGLFILLGILEAGAKCLENRAGNNRTTDNTIDSLVEAVD